MVHEDIVVLCQGQYEEFGPVTNGCCSLWIHGEENSRVQPANLGSPGKQPLKLCERVNTSAVNS